MNELRPWPPDAVERFKRRRDGAAWVKRWEVFMQESALSRLRLPPCL